MFIYYCYILIIIEIKTGFHSVDIELRKVEAEGVCVKVEFWPCFQTSLAVIQIAAE